MKTIYCMSSSKSALAQHIEDITFPTMCGITQLYLFPNSEYRNHWIAEVWANFHSMKLLKSKNKLPKESFILDNSWGCNSKFVNTAIKKMIEKEADLCVRPDANEFELYDILDTYFRWLSKRLSKEPNLTLAEVSDEISKLGL